MEVLSFELKVQRTGHDTYKNSQEYKIGKINFTTLPLLTKLIKIKKDMNISVVIRNKNQAPALSFFVKLNKTLCRY
jgi:hypothetical protein